MPNHWSRYWPTNAVAAERQQQRDAADHRRQHQRQRDQRAHQPQPGEVRCAPGPRPAARRRPARSPWRPTTSTATAAAPRRPARPLQDLPEVAPGGPQEQPGQRDDQERDRDEGGHEERQRRRPRPSAGHRPSLALPPAQRGGRRVPPVRRGITAGASRLLRSPAAVSTPAPSGDRTKSTKAAAAAALALVVSAAIG